MTRVLLLGSMGTGKSTVGEAIALLTGWPHLDNDVLMQRTTGSTAAELLATHGVERLRASESDTLTLVLGLPGPLVAGVAAGVVLDPADRERLRAGGHVVWLRASVPVLVRRVGRGTGRPWLDGDPGELLTRLAAERDPLYAEVAHQVIDTDVTPAGRIARDILERLGLPV